MSTGLNPSGLGRTDTFGKTKHEELSTEEGVITGKSDITINVPSDYGDIQSAVVAAGEYIRQRPGTIIAVNIESGHTVTTQVEVIGVDLRNIRITSDDSSVDVDASSGWEDKLEQRGSQPLFNAQYGARLPIITTEFDLTNDAGQDTLGVLANRGSGVVVGDPEASNHDISGAGFRDFTDGALIINTSWMEARGGFWTDHSGNALHARHGSYINHTFGVVRRSGTGLLARRNSGIDGFNINALDCENCTVARDNSRIFVETGLLDDATGSAVIADRLSVITLFDTSVTGCGDRPIDAWYLGAVASIQCDFDMATNPIRAKDGGVVGIFSESNLSADPVVEGGGVVIHNGVRKTTGIDIDPSNTYSMSNVTTDRTIDANNTSDAELADVLCTLIQDLGLDD